jgi:hypothetical protein
METTRLSMSNTFKTKAGTILPLTNLRGKDYLEVKYRVMWFREEHPNRPIETEVLQHTDSHSVVRATIRDENGRVLATGMKREDAKHFIDHLEKAETGAIGRAIALCGYGTQFAIEMEEGERIVDSPIPQNRLESPIPRPQMAPAPHMQPAARNGFRPNQPVQRVDTQGPANLSGHSAYDWVIPKGKNEGQRLGNLPPGQRTKIAEFFNKDGEPKGWCKEFVEKDRELVFFEQSTQLMQPPEETGFADSPPIWVTENS